VVYVGSQKNEFELDVIVLSRDRNQELIHSIAAWVKQPYRFVILHNSEKPLDLGDITENVVYMHLPSLNYGERAKVSTELLKSPFSMILADDERLVSSGINSLIRNLKDNVELASVGGRVLGVYQYGGRIAASFAYQHMNGYQNLDLDVSARLRRHLNQEISGGFAIGGLYRIMRREYMEKILNLLAKSAFIQKKTPFVYEVVGEFAVASIGPTATYDEIYWIRNWQTRMVRRKDWNRNQGFKDWWADSRNASDRKQLISILSEFANQVEAETENCIEKSFNLRGPYQEKRQINQLETKIRSSVRGFLKQLGLPLQMPRELKELLTSSNIDMSETYCQEIMDTCGEMLTMRSNY
jgi:hypothetical protein